MVFFRRFFPADDMAAGAVRDAPGKPAAERPPLIRAGIHEEQQKKGTDRHGSSKNK